MESVRAANPGKLQPSTPHPPVNRPPPPRSYLHPVLTGSAFTLGLIATAAGSSGAGAEQLAHELD